MGKGSSPRKRQVSRQENSDNWDRTFGKQVVQSIQDLPTLRSLSSKELAELRKQVEEDLNCTCLGCIADEEDERKRKTNATNPSEREAGPEDVGSEVRRVPAEGSDPLPQ